MSLAHDAILPPPRRAMCARCLRPQQSCICGFVAPVASRVELLILQHPLEVAQAKGSARLLHMCLPGSMLATGETFAPAQLAALLDGGGRVPVLLYPDTPDARALRLPAPPALDPALLLAPARLRLVVLDGTWRKSRKMLYLNPLLQQLPRLALTEVPASRYGIRKAQGPDQLSTLEASCYALMQIERDAARYAPVIGAFDGFVAQQARYQGAAAAQ
ncbi:tRNA-uridine aminocarboxypropyltransferase [Massilia glaciei]|uniref:tRNA-uridine aminocarboxypropyltransferase n=1 Tax=Massilia glaciei TaxID=1524097 RepID=A0A2U2HDH4_9BURK|nr:tRNA-uridine aminocarboxypropyltransferase [Massilia glaciei]PWF41064.1 DTW domain-containing protein [Massilia glaciei]